MSSITMNLCYTGQNGNAQSAIRRRMKLSLRQMRHLSGSEAQAVRMIQHCEQRQKDLNRAQMKTIRSIAEAHGVSSAQVILRWDLQRGIVAIPGSSNPEHIKEKQSLNLRLICDRCFAILITGKRKPKHNQNSKRVVEKMSEEIKKIEDERLRKAAGGESVVEGDHIVLKGYGKDGKYHEIRFANNYSGYQQMQQMAARLGIET